MARRHWSEAFACSCGKTFRSYAAEAVHRHNFPALCRAPRRSKSSSKPLGSTVKCLSSRS